MPTTRTHDAEQSGPLTLDVQLTAGRIRIHPTTGRAKVTVFTTDTEGPSADAVNDTRITDSGTNLAVRVPQGANGSGTIIVGGGNVMVGNFGGGASIVQTGNGMFINGRLVAGGANVVVGGSPILVEAWLPAGSSLTAQTTSADVECGAALDRADVRTVSGDVDLDEVNAPELRTTSGDVSVDALAGSGRIDTVSGDVRVRAVRECTLRANTVSGDVRVTGARVQLDARSVSGRVRNG